MTEEELLQIIQQAAEDQVTSLDLSDRELRALPPEIGQLSHLTELNLWNNQLSVLPPEIGQLFHLTVLNLADNQLSALPPEIGNLTNLKALNLQKNPHISWPEALYVGDNPLTFPSTEILDQGIDTTLAYLREARHTEQP